MNVFRPVRSFRLRRTGSQSIGQWAGWRTALLLPFLAVATGCSDTVVTTVDVQQVRVNPSEAPLPIGSVIQLQAELLDNEGKAVTGVPVSWSTEDASIVDVNGDGEVTGRSAGEAIVRATADGVTGLATIHVLHTVPAAPSDLVVRPVDVDDGMNVRLEWRDNSDDETGFRIERRNVTSEGEFELLTTVEQDVTSYPDETVSADATYSYRVLACAAGGCSSSDAVSISTSPLAPSGLEAEAQSSTAIRITWSDNSVTEIAFELERKTGAGDYARINRLERNSTSFEDTNLDPGTTYSYRIRACNEDSCSSYSAAAAATTHDPAPPAAPSGLTAQAVSDIQINLSWQDNSDNETSFEIWRRMELEQDFTKQNSVAAGETSFEDTGVLPGTTYIYWVRACSNTGCSPASNSATATTSLLAAPSGLTASRVTEDYVDLTWKNNSEGETEFRILRRRTNHPGNHQFEQIGSTTTDAVNPTFRDRNVKEEWSYEYQVQTCDSSGRCESSNTITVTIPDD